MNISSTSLISDFLCSILPDCPQLDSIDAGRANAIQRPLWPVALHWEFMTAFLPDVQWDFASYSMLGRDYVYHNNSLLFQRDLFGCPWQRARSAAGSGKREVKKPSERAAMWAPPVWAGAGARAILCMENIAPCHRYHNHHHGHHNRDLATLGKDDQRKTMSENMYIREGKEGD